MQGAPPQFPSLVGLSGKRTVQQVLAVMKQGAGRMPSFPNLSQEAATSIAEYVLNGESKELASAVETRAARSIDSRDITSFSIRMDIRRSRLPGEL